MLRTSARRAVAVLGAGIIVTAMTLASGVAPAEAAARGYLAVKGSGSLYSRTPVVVLGVAAGSTPKTFYYKVVNKGATDQRFRVVLASGRFGAKLYDGFRQVPNDYLTKTIGRGKTASLKVRIAVPAGTEPGLYRTKLEMFDPDAPVVIDPETGERVALSESYAQVDVTTPSSSRANDLYLKTGAQPFVGGGGFDAKETASAVRIGGTASFTLQVRNNSDHRAATKLEGKFKCESSIAYTVKEGLRDVTAAVRNGTYSVTLNPGQKKDLRVLVKLVYETCDNSFSGEAVFYDPDAEDRVDATAHVVEATS